VIRQAAVLLEQCESREARDRLYRETLAALSNALEAKDGETSDHTQEVGELAIEVATVLGLPGDEVRHVELGALLHDIGKIRVPESILLKAGPLTDEQWEVMRSHPEVGERILAPMQSLEDVLPIVRSSHERWDGTGYPDGLAGEAIPLGARIVAVCDAYRAMVEDRPYRKALSRRCDRGDAQCRRIAVRPGLCQRAARGAATPLSSARPAGAAPADALVGGLALLEEGADRLALDVEADHAAAVVDLDDRVGRNEPAPSRQEPGADCQRVGNVLDPTVHRTLDLSDDPPAGVCYQEADRLIEVHSDNLRAAY
jgi:putative nucleotidyltransferase with HDIG domain